MEGREREGCCLPITQEALTGVGRKRTGMWTWDGEGLLIGWVRSVGKMVVEGDRIQEPNGGGRKDVDSLRELLVLNTQGLCRDGD